MSGFQGGSLEVLKEPWLISLFLVLAVNPRPYQCSCEKKYWYDQVLGLYKGVLLLTRGCCPSLEHPTGFSLSGHDSSRLCLGYRWLISNAEGDGLVVCVSQVMACKALNLKESPLCFQRSLTSMLSRLQFEQRATLLRGATHFPLDHSAAEENL